MKKKVCMIGPDPTVMGGISTVVQGYLQSELIKNYNVMYLSSHKDGNKITKLCIVLKAYFKFFYICLYNKPDIIHIHSSFGASFYRKAIFIKIGKWFDLPIINHVHGADFNKFYVDATDKNRKIIKKVYSKCDSIIVLSKEWEKKFLDIVPQQKISVIENYALYPNKINDIKDKENIILFLGEVGKRKGAYDIPKVVEKVKEISKDFKFIICGNGEVENIKKIALNKKIAEYIEFRGWIGKDEKVSLLKKAKIYFLPSYNEGLPMSILEGMAYGLPVVSTIVGGIPTVVENNKNGYLCNPGDCDGFSDAIIKILNNENLAEYMSQNNYKKIKHNYSLKSNIIKLNDIYIKLINKRKINKEM